MQDSSATISAPIQEGALSLGKPERLSGLFLGRLDPRAKLVMVFCLSSVIYSAVNLGIWYELAGAAFSLFLLATARMYRGAFGLCCFFVVAFAFQFIIAPLLGADNMVGFVLSMAFVVFRHFIPSFILLVFLIATTQTAELTVSLRKMHVPQGVTVALAVLFRFFPTVSEQFRAIKGAMRLKGIPLTFANFFTHPLRTFEYGIVPLMSSSLKIGTELSCAALCRGLGYSDRQTSIVEVKLRVGDYVCMGVCLLIFVGCMYLV